MADAKKKKPTGPAVKMRRPTTRARCQLSLSFDTSIAFLLDDGLFERPLVYPPPCPSLGRRFCSGAKPAAAPAVAAMHIWSVAWTRPNLALGSLIKYLKAADRAKAAPPSPWRRSRAGAAKRESQTCPARAEKNGAKIDRHRVIRRRFTDGFT